MRTVAPATAVIPIPHAFAARLYGIDHQAPDPNICLDAPPAMPDQADPAGPAFPIMRYGILSIGAAGQVV